MNPRDEQTILDWALQQPQPAVIFTARGSGDADAALAAFCDRFKQLAPGTHIRKAPEDSFRSPALIIGRHANISYQAVPEGKELGPFLEALSADDAESKAQDPATPIELPAQLTLFIAMQCPHCPQVVRQLTALAQSAARLRVAIIDGVMFGQEAKAQGIRSVPTLILDDRLRWVGRIDMREVVDQCGRRDPSQLAPASLRQMLEAGEAPRAAALMIEQGQVFPALLELLMNERWSVRLGAMVTAEYLVDQAPHLAEQLIAPLWERFGDLSEPVQGDVVHVLGQIASGTAKACLQRIAAGDFEESVKQAAIEELGEK